ncbi:hypothetical protein MLD38_039832 [Melastoma candidum]|uniref:Uncharacterized protein n=1 Tax=Melastoma candidum TaxID=119954 RepID=A0ACB9L3C5_9MYRT|nr:hypothetical protein MLD38_039832 [Melastoma candidum]
MSKACRRLRSIFADTVTPGTRNPTSRSGNAKPLAGGSSSQLYMPLFIRNGRSFENSVLRLLREKDISVVEARLQDQKRHIRGREGFAVQLMLLYGRVGLFEGARKVFDEMPDLGCSRSALSLNSLLEAAINSEEWEMVDLIFRDLSKELSLDANLITYNTVMKAYCKMGRFHDAEDLLVEMEAGDIAPDVVTFNTILNGLYKSGNFTKGEKLWELMLSKNIEPTIRSYNARLRGMVLETLVGDAVKLFEEMQEKGVMPDVFSYNPLISAYCNLGDLDEAKKWYRRMVEKGIGVDKVTVAALVPILCEKGEFEMAYRLCVEAIDKRLVKEAELLQSAVDCMVKESQVGLAEKIVEKWNSKKRESSLEFPLNSSE